MASDATNGEKKINTNNKELCSNHTFWKGVSCHVHSHGEVDTVESFGHRCTGTSQQCVYPWYRNIHGNIFAQSACSDKSDKVFPSDAPCPNSTSFMEIHNSLFCSNSSEISSYYICTHPADWVGQQSDDAGEYHAGREGRAPLGEHIETHGAGRGRLAWR